MRKLRSAPIVIGLALAGCLGLVACGSDDKTSGGDDSAAQAGGSIKIGSALPDSYDPVLFQTVQANQALQLVYTGLVTYKHADGAEGTELIPGLAEAMPTVSEDKKTYTFKLREGLKYSDGTDVKASDFEHTIKRLNFLGGPFASFTAQIEGIPEYQKAKKANADISGITADDATGEITVKLSVADGKFLYAIGAGERRADAGVQGAVQVLAHRSPASGRTRSTSSTRRASTSSPRRPASTSRASPRARSTRSPSRSRRSRR